MILLYRAMWSPRYSQCLTGYTQYDHFIHTPTLFATDKESVYRTSDGVEYLVITWVPTDWRDKKGK